MIVQSIYTDGSALAHAARGGWAFVRDDGRSRSGAADRLGPNQAELRAVVEALASLPRRAALRIYTDSKYVLAGVRRRDRPEGALWDELFLWRDFHRSVAFEKVKTHPLHTQAHHLARAAVFASV